MRPICSAVVFAVIVQSLADLPPLHLFLQSYYLAPILRTIGIVKPSQINGLNAGLALFNLFAAVGAALLVDRVGRRRLWLTSTTGLSVKVAFSTTHEHRLTLKSSRLLGMCFITALSATYLRTSRALVGRAVVAFVFIFDGFYDLGQFHLPKRIYHLYTKLILRSPSQRILA